MEPETTSQPRALTVEMWPITRIQPYEMNARKIPRSAVDKVAASLREYGWRQPIVVDANGVIIVGHVRRLGAIQNGWTEAPVHVAHDLTPAQAKAYRLMDNRSHDEASWDAELLGTELLDLKGLDAIDLQFTGFGADEIAKLISPIEDVATEARASLSERFGVPPFSILDARQGYWQARKKAWLALGIKSELGRGGQPGLTMSETVQRLKPGADPAAAHTANGDGAAGAGARP